MADTRNLVRFSVEPKNGAFQLHVEDDAGETLELTATEDQLDLIVEALDEALSTDSSSDEIEEEDEGED